MKKSLPFLFVLSLLIGILVTVATTRVAGGEQVQNCGFSINSQTNQHTTLRNCLLNTYGWPLKYSTSGVEAILRDYHTIVPNDPTNAGSIIGYTSFSFLRFVADWVAWSVAAGILVSAVGVLTYTPQLKKPARKNRHT